LSVAIAAVCGLAAVAASAIPRCPGFVWNASASIAPGLYRIEASPPGLRQIALVRLSRPLVALALERGYLRGTALLLKPVVAGPGDRVCRVGQSIMVRGRLAGTAEARDGDGRALPQWRGCRVLGLRQYFLLSSNRGSFDSRYFGPVTAIDVVGTARPV
jgi:conjugative transfer signal peptidase TraF